MTPLGWATLGVLALYMLAFAGLGRLTAHKAERPVWLFGRAQGVDRAAAWGSRVALALALAGPVVLAASPGLAAFNLLAGMGRPILTLAGHLLAVAGALLAAAAQAGMGVSRRVGVVADQVELPVTGALHGLSRNLAFLGQRALLTGVTLALPSVATLLAAVLFALAARTQVAAKERVLGDALEEPYRTCLARVPRWLPCRAPGTGPTKDATDPAPTDCLSRRRWAGPRCPRATGRRAAAGRRA